MKHTRNSGRIGILGQEVERVAEQLQALAGLEAPEEHDLLNAEEGGSLGRTGVGGRAEA